MNLFEAKAFGNLTILYLQIWNCAFESGELSLSQTLGIITFISKGSKTRDIFNFGDLYHY